MNPDYKIQTHVRASNAVGRDTPVNTGLADKVHQDRNALRSGVTYARLADFYRVVPRELVEKDLLAVLQTNYDVEGHTVREYEPVGMIEDTKVKLFGKELSGEVHFDETIIQLVKQDDGKFCKATVEGQLPEFITGVEVGTWSSSRTLREALIRSTVQHYAELRQKPKVVHKTYSDAMKAKDYAQAYVFLENGLEALELHAKGSHKLTQDEIKSIVAMLNSANGAPRFQAYMEQHDG